MSLVIKGSKIFDGTGVVSGNSVLVDNGKIRATGNDLKGDEVREFPGAFIMPGMTDAHIHLSGATQGNLLMESLIKDPRTRLLRSVTWLDRLLKAGFTTVRDCGEENSLFLRDAVKQGTFNGPNILAAGMPLSQTFGHGEFSHTVPLEWNADRGLSELCDGADECMKAARKVFRQGSDFIKIFTTGGVLSEKDHPNQEQFTLDEIRAIVREAEKAGTYVAAHAHGDLGIRNAVAGGVKTIEHSTLASDGTLKLMAEHGVSITPTLTIQELIGRYGRELGVNEWGLEKIGNVREGIANVLPKAHKLGLNILCGTDLGFETGKDLDIGRNWMELVFMVEIGGFSPVEALKTATGNVKKIGLPAGTFEEGMPADIVVIDGDPSENIRDIEKIREVYRNGKEVFMK